MNIDFNLKILSFNRRISLTKQTFQYGVGVITVVAATIAAYWGSLKLYTLVAAAFVGLIVLLVLMRQLAIGYFILLLGGIFIPVSGPGGINVSMVMVIVMVFLWAMDMFITKRRFEFIRSGPIRPTLYFMIVCIAALLMGQVLWYVTSVQAPLDTQLGGFAIYFFSLGVLVMTGNIIKDIRWLKAFVWLFVGLGAFYVVARALNISLIDNYYTRGFTANSMLWVWLVAIPLGQVIYNQELTRRQRAALFFVVFITMYVAIVQSRDWKSGWVPSLIVIAVLVGIRFPKLAFASIPFAAIGFIYFAQQQIMSEGWSWGTRLDAWRIVLEVSRLNPILGLGFANYYWYVTLFNIRGYYVQFNSHSQYVDLIAQTGIVGLICFIWIFVEVARLAWALTRRLTDGFARGYAFGVLAGLAGAAVAAFLVDWVLPFAYNIGLKGFRASILPWIFFGGLISIEQIFLSNVIKDRERVQLKNR